MDHYELRRENGGCAIYKNSKRIDWHIDTIPQDRTMQWWVKQLVLKDPKNRPATLLVKGIEGSSLFKDETMTIEPCPTKHADLGDDFMGGTICRDCRTVW